MLNFFIKKNEYECQINSLNTTISNLNKRLASNIEEYELAANNLTIKLNDSDKKVKRGFI